jgi:anti-sigma regulatory factor (Ser/Thr protein kinase)
VAEERLIGELRLLPALTSPAEARAWTRELLVPCALRKDDVHWAEQLVNELVTNAVIHARTAVQVRVYEGRSYRFVVTDRGVDGPMPRIVELSDGSGRGLRIVATMAARWGVARDDAGTSVWFELKPA